MPLTPVPTATQIEQVREAARLNSFAQTAALINTLHDEQWVVMIATLVDWEAARHDEVKIGGKSGSSARVQIDPVVQRQLLTDEIRERLGLRPLFSGFGSPLSGASPTEVKW